MKTDIHPEYKTVTVHCSCGNSFETRSTASGDELRVELCSECHPFYTGKQKLVDTGGRIDRFERRYGRRKKGGAPVEEPAQEPEAAQEPETAQESGGDAATES